MSTETSPTAAPADAGGEDHLAAANEFFAAQQAPAKEPAKEPVKEPAKEVVKEPAKPDPLATVLKAAAKQEAPAAQAEAPTLEDIDKGLQAPPDNAKSRAGWDELKKRATDERKLRLELEAKLKTAGSPVDEATKARLAELETQNKTFSERLKVLDLKAHPEFHSRYVMPAEQAKLAMANIAKSDEVEVNLDEVLSLKGKALNKEVSDVMERMTPYARVKFQASLDAYFTAQAGADQAIAQADESLKALKTTGGARSRASFDEVAGSYKDAFLPAPVDEKAPDPTASEYNQALSQIGARARGPGEGPNRGQRAGRLRLRGPGGGRVGGAGLAPVGRPEVLLPLTWISRHPLARGAGILYPDTTVVAAPRGLAVPAIGKLSRRMAPAGARTRGHRTVTSTSILSDDG